LYNVGEEGTNQLYNAEEVTKQHLHEESTSRLLTVTFTSLSSSTAVPTLSTSAVVSRLSTATTTPSTMPATLGSPQPKITDSKADSDIKDITIEKDPAEVVFTHVYNSEIEETKEGMKTEDVISDISESLVTKVKVIEEERAVSKEADTADIDDSNIVTDPVAELLANVLFLDIADYLPRGYQYEEEDSDRVSAEDTDVDVPVEMDDAQKFKPGKLNGKKLAVMSQELAEAELYFSTFGGKKPTAKGSSGGKTEEYITTEVKTKISPVKTNNTRPSYSLISQLRRSRLESAPSRASLSTPTVSRPPQASLGNTTRLAKPARRLTSRIITPRPLRFRAFTSATKSSPSPRATSSTTSRPTTPGVCGTFCSLAGTIVIEAGLEWSEELLHSFTEMYKDATSEIVGEMSKVFENAFYGRAFEFISVEAYSEHEENVLVDFYAQFSGQVFNNKTTTDLKNTLEENLIVENDKLKMGKFVIDLNATSFVVVDTTIPLEMIGLEIADEILPDWAWLVVVGGMISTFIIAFFGVIMGVQKYKHNQVVKTKVLNPKTLDAFRGQMHFATVSVGHGTAYANDKRDMWTLQKAQQAELDKANRKNFYRSIVSQNDSNAELLGGFDDTAHDESGGVLDNETEEGEHEAKVPGSEVFSRNSNLRVSRGDLLDRLGEW